LSLDRVITALIGLGLTRTEGEIYVYLAKVGPQQVIDLSKALNYDKQKIVTSLNNLQKKGIICIISQKPPIYSALPFEEALNLLIRIRKNQEQAMDEIKEKRLETWKTKD
jgi:sugar-specific transcriptional regulator TrmB